jgi:sn-glycerol 3-phosphate transport system permease protein
MAAEKRVAFRNSWLPWALLAPQVVVIAVFFFWPAGQALLQSLQQSDAFGTSVEWVGLANFKQLFSDPTYLTSFRITAVFSALVAVLGLGISLLLAVFADRVVRGSGAYRTLLIWPYAVAPAVAGVLWLFMFAPSICIVSYALQNMGYDWNHLLDSGDAMMLIVLAACGSRSRTTSCSSSPGYRASRARSSRPRRSTARGRGGASGRSSSRCSRRPPSSC